MKSKLEFIGAMLIFGTIGLFRRMIPFPSSFIAASRGLIGTLFLIVFLALTHQKLSWHTIRTSLVPLLLSGTMMGFNWILLFESYNTTSVAVSTVCYYMAPVFVILAAPVLFKDVLTRKKLFCALISFAGILLVSGIFKTSFTGLQEMTGILFGLGAAVLYASVILLNKKMKQINAFDRTVVQLGTSGLVLLPYTLMTEQLVNLEWNGTVLFLLLVTGIVHTGVAYALYFHSIKEMDAHSIALYSYIDPVSAIVFSALFLKEPMSLIEITGMLLILGAALISEFHPKLPQKENHL